jgi:hypothetical protein
MRFFLFLDTTREEEKEFYRKQKNITQQIIENNEQDNKNEGK